jgi:CPA2 family monovalent cation:H+ antiporter-2
MWRGERSERAHVFDLRQTLTDLDIVSLGVDPGSEIAGQALAETDLRRIYGVTVLAIRRGEDLLPNPGGDEVAAPGDVMVVMGLGEEIAAASALFRRRREHPGTATTSGWAGVAD